MRESRCYRTPPSAPVARQLLEQHGGEVRAESTPGKGLEFIVELPLGPQTGIGVASRL